MLRVLACTCQATEQSRDERCSLRRVDSSKSAFRRSPLTFAMRLEVDMDYASVALEQGGAVLQSTEEMSPGQAHLALSYGFQE